MLCRKTEARKKEPGSGWRPAGRQTAALPLFLACAAASAATWEWAPRIEGGYKYNDNYRLDPPGSEIDVSGAEADAQLALRTIDPRTTIEITPRIRATYFPDESDFDSTDYFLRGLFEDATPRRRAGVRAEFSDEDVIRSELPDTEFEGDLGDPQLVDSGRTIERNRRDLIRVNPYFSYDLTQRFRLDLEARYVDATFDREIAGSFQDFTDASASAGLGFQSSQRSRLMFRALASQYETTFDTDAYGAQAEWTTDFSPTARMYVSLGAQQTSPARGEGHTNVIGGIGGRWTSQRNALFLDLTSSVGPISAGTVVERHQLRLRIDHDVSPRLALVFGLRALRDEDIDDDGSYPTREYATTDAGLEWRWQRYLAFTATYNYRWRKYSNEPSDASANGFLIGVVYEPKRRD